MRDRVDALIIGAGPAGSAAAILLARAGLSVALIEKQRFPRRKVCGECIAASNLPLLEALGVGAAFAASAGPDLRRVALMRSRSCVVADLPPAADERHRWGRALGRETLDVLLLERARAAGAHVLQPWYVRSIEGDDDARQCVLRAVESEATLRLHARVVIAASGSWEPLPWLRATTDAPHRPSDLLAFKANFQGAALADGLLPVLSFNGGYGGMVVADAGITTLACCVRRDRLLAARRAAPGLAAGEVVERLLKHQCAGVEAALRPAERIDGWIAAGRLQPGVRLAAGDPLLRIGNAAGEAHPIIGEGISMALQSAFLLCAHLIAPLQSDRRGWRGSVGHAYAAQWRRAFGPRLLIAATFANAAMRPAAAPALLALMRAWPALLTAGARWSGKVASAASPASIVA
jgi:flavin-dependent dehydrogenase